MRISNVKGSKDFLPDEENIRIYINDILRSTFLEYGYLPIETPILCDYDMLVSKYDENNDLVKEIYKVTDQGNRRLGLRYDLTVPFAKFIALNKNNISIPFKRYEINKVFRDGPIKLGRDREFTQCDADVVGLGGEYIEAECLDLYVNAFNKLDIEIEIKYNSRNLLRGLIKEVGIKEELVGSVVTIIDKMNKMNKDEITNLFLEIGLTKDDVDNLFNAFSLSLSEIKNNYSNTSNNELLKGVDEVSNLSNYLKELNIDSYCSFDSTLARGQDYYTGIIFEVFDKSGYITSSIAAGGRYDKMIGDYIGDGNIYPAVGLSFGLSSIYEIVRNRQSIDINVCDLYIIPINTEINSLKLASSLRREGLRVIVELNKRKVKKALSWASKNKIPYVTVIGEDEVNSKTIKLKNMNKEEEFEVNIDNIEEILKIINV